MTNLAPVLALLLAATAAAQDPAWPPAAPTASEFAGRKLETYRHASRPEWGYKAPQRDTFLVLNPKEARAKPPLYVVLHSAGHDVHSCLACTAKVGNHDIYHAPPDFLALYLDCKANKGDWWWGINSHLGPDPGPTERRVVDTVMWVVEKYGADPDRVYLCGNSMGGSGALGIGVRHGDVFAAVKANVPAEVKHVSSRMYFPPKDLPADLNLPDPPVVVDYSAPNDSWSRGHDGFARAMNDRKYPLLMYWGPFGHANNHAAILKVNDLVNSFDWLGVRKDEAYPAFTNASTDDPLPWPDNLGEKNAGQVNAFFRWKAGADAADRVEVSLFLAKPGELKTTLPVPAESTADVSLRRLRTFRVAPGQKVAWKYGARGGEAVADPRGVVTVPRLTVTAEPTALVLTRPK